MNFLNPFALIGLAAAGIPLLLHLLNLRRLRVMEFSTLRFLQELQLTRVRRLKLQQILLLILRTLLIVLAVLAFSRPTIPTAIPLLATASRASVVILVDNSASMEANDQSGQRFRQAVDAARHVVSMLKDGDEVCVLPLAGQDAMRSVGFTRTFAEAQSEIDRISLTEASADIPNALRSVSSLFKDASHPYHEVYVVSDAQRSTVTRIANDTGIVFNSDASIFLVRIGQGLSGLEQNHSVDSINVLTKLIQPDRPIEVEAFVRNGSERDASNVIVTLAFDGVRIAQRAADIPAGATRSVVLGAPPQRSGIVRVSVELEDDAITRDNVRFAGVVVPEPARTAIVGTGLPCDLIATALSLPDSRGSQNAVKRFSQAREVVGSLSTLDVVFLVNGTWSQADATMLSQFVERGGGIVVFTSEAPSVAPFMSMFGISVADSRQAPNGTPWRIRSIDEQHPLFSGVFKNSQRNGSVVETPVIKRMRAASGGVTIASADVGGFLVESGKGAGRVVYVATMIDPEWSTMGLTGLFPATMVRSSQYLMLARDVMVTAPIGETITATIPARFSGEPAFVVSDNNSVKSVLQAAQLSTSSLLTIPAQKSPGVVAVQTQDSAAVLAITVNAPMEESRLNFFANNEWTTAVMPLVNEPSRILETKPGTALTKTTQTARTGSELWPLCILLAIACAIAESLVSRFMASEESVGVTA